MPTRDAPPGAPFVLAMSTRCGFIETLPSIRNRRSEQSSFRSRNAQVRVAAHPLREASQSLWTGPDRRYVRLVPQWRERAMDVRGPTRAAAKRLTTGMVVACTVAAVSAPAAMAGTVSNVHSIPLDETGAPLPEVAAPAGYAAASGENNAGTLELVEGGAVFAATGTAAGSGVTVSGTTGGFDTTIQEDTCFPDAAVVNWTCPLAS